MQHDYGAWLDGFPDALIPGLTALDIGCGSGDDTVALLDAGLHVVAFDLNPDRVRRAACRAPTASFLVADLRTGLPFLNATIDLAVASLSLHYFDRATTARILGDLHRVLMPGATLLARVNVVGDVPSLWGVGIEHEQDYFEVEPGHCKRFFTESSLQEVLDPFFVVNHLVPRTTLVHGRHPKQTLVARATRRDE